MNDLNLRPILAVLLLSSSLFACSSDSETASPGMGADDEPRPTGTPDATDTVENPRTADGGVNTSDPTPSTAAPTSSGTAPEPGSTAEPPPDVKWEPCGVGQCATLQVPVNYADPSQGTLGLRVFVGNARLSSRRGGVLMFNPGGPGAPVVEDAADYFALFSSYLPTMDIVLMDNRGMGQSEPTDCVGPAFLDTRFADLSDEWSTSQLEQISDVWRDFNAGCIERMGKPVVENLHSINVARDMDRVREALGEERISVWNVSYGTVQASLYGKLFPEHVNAFVLDSPVYFGNATHVDDVQSAIEAYDNELTRFLDWCAATAVCGLGETQQEVSTSYDDLRAALAPGVVYDGEIITDLVLDNVAAGLLMYGDWETFAAVLEQAVRGNLDMLVAAAMAESEDPEAGHAMWQANFVVRLLDYGCPADYTTAAALAEIQAALQAHPRIANVYAWHFTACLGWQTRAAEGRLETNDLESAPFLLLTSAHDAATPVEGARNLVAQLNNDSALVVVEKEGHGVIGIDSYGTTQGVNFVRDLNPAEGCSGPSCFGFGGLALNNLAPSQQPRLKLPRIKPRPLRPLRH